jgi:hypothetical protein
LKVAKVLAMLGVWKGSKGTVKVSDAKDNEDEEMGVVDEKPMKMRC